MSSAPVTPCVWTENAYADLDTLETEIHADVSDVIKNVELFWNKILS